MRDTTKTRPLDNTYVEYNMFEYTGIKTRAYRHVRRVNVYKGSTSIKLVVFD